eukprot:166613-Pleurochrysis_carterae.AAC.1
MGGSKLGSAKGAGGRYDYKNEKRDVATSECPGALPVGPCGANDMFRLSRAINRGSHPCPMTSVKPA